MSTTKMALFDIDNTLVYGRRASAFYSLYSRVLEKTLADVLDIPLNEALAIANEYRAKYNGRGELAFTSYQINMAVWYDALSTLRPEEYLEPMPASRNLIKLLKRNNVIVGAITDGPRTLVNRILQTAGIDKNDFDIIIGWERGAPMPKYGSNAIFEKVCKDMNILPNEAVMIGDSLSSDVMPALAAGLRAIHIADKKRSSDGSYATVDNIEALTDLTLII